MDKETANKLQLLAENYTKSLPNKLKEIEMLWQSLQKNWDKEIFSQLYHKVHNLHGSAGIYGHPALSSAAHQFELLLKSSSEQQIEPEALEKMQQAFSAIVSPSYKASPKDTTQKTAKKPIAKITNIYLFEKDSNISQQMALQLNSFGYYTQVFDDTNQLPEVTKDVFIIANTEMLDTTLEKYLLKIKDQYTVSTPPIIFITKKADLSLHLKAIRVGTQGYFVLPFQAEEIIAKIQEINDEVLPAKVLIVEDSEETAKYYTELFHAVQLETKIIAHPLDLDKILHEFNPDLILMDMHMPGYNGLEIATVIRQRKAFEGIPIIFLSADDDQEKQIKMLNIGADDFITKSSDDHFLILAVKNRIKRYKVLRNLISKDGLTGVLNHTSAQQRLESELALAQRSKIPLSVAIIDLDHFKQINDTYGHPTGDQLLKKICAFLQNRLRKSDIIGRYGGDEFLLIFPNTQGNVAKSILDGLREQFASLTNVKTNTFKVTFSAGVASAPPSFSAEILIQKSDEALYAAKRQGRNNVVLAS